MNSAAKAMSALAEVFQLMFLSVLFYFRIFVIINFNLHLSKLVYEFAVYMDIDII